MSERRAYRARWGKDALLTLLICSSTVMVGGGCIKEFVADLFGGRLSRSRRCQTTVADQPAPVQYQSDEGIDVTPTVPEVTLAPVEETVQPAPPEEFSSHAPVQLSFSVGRQDEQFSIDPNNITVHDRRTNEIRPLPTKGHVFSKKPKVYWITEAGATRIGEFEYG